MRDSVKVFTREIQPHEWIPVETDTVFLTKRVRIFVQRYFFIDVLELIDLAPLFFPFSQEPEDPIFDTGETHFQSLGGPVVICIPEPVGRYPSSVVKSSLRIRWCKWWRVWHGFQVEKHRIIIDVLVGVTEAKQNGQTIARHPKQVGINEVLFGL